MRARVGEGGLRGTMVWPAVEREVVTIERARAQAGEGGTTPISGVNQGSVGDPRRGILGGVVDLLTICLHDADPENLLISGGVVYIRSPG